MRNWGDESHFDWRADPKPPRVFPRRFSWASFWIGAALSTFVICGAQWLYNRDPQWAFASLAALLATPIPWVLAGVE